MQVRNAMVMGVELGKWRGLRWLKDDGWFEQEKEEKY